MRFALGAALLAAVYPAVRWLTRNPSDALLAQLAVLALWYFDPTLRWSWLGGTLDTGLNAVPYVGALKNAVEVVRGDVLEVESVVSALEGIVPHLTVSNTQD